MEIRARVVQKLPTESGTSKNGNQWSKASLIAETEGQYPKKIKISNMKNADTFSRIAVGTEITFKVEIESREYNGRWYTEVSCWGWDAAQSNAPATQPATTTAPETEKQMPPVEEADDLPF
ncbi:MAG: DUF3127 domain-containing protein [Alistipes sp.]|nr:DUF3127 domain-containing protein [Lachnospiraceae bacterium]MCM1250279.1 DUF3127 domain-containing protein [Alistipes sp.]